MPRHSYTAGLDNNPNFIIRTDVWGWGVYWGERDLCFWDYFTVDFFKLYRNNPHITNKLISRCGIGDILSGKDKWNITASGDIKIVKHAKHDICNKGQWHWNGSSELKMLQRQLSVLREGRRWLAGSAHCCCGKCSDMFICVSDIFVSLQVTFTRLEKSLLPIYRHPQYTGTQCGEQRAAICRGLTVLWWLS